MVRLELLGRFRVTYGETAVPDETWTRRDTAALVKILCLAPRHRMRRDRLAATLWPGLTPQAAATNLRRTVHLVRRLYPGHYDVVPVESVGDMIGLPAGRVWVDVVAFRSGIAQARRTRSPQAYAAATDLYRGTLLPDDGDEWLHPHRTDLHRDFVAALEEYASLLEAAGHLDEAARVTRLHLAADPVAEAAQVRLLRVLALAGRREEATRAYRDLTAPGAEAQHLHTELRVRHPARLSALLWEQVGDLRMAAGDTRHAVSAYRSGLELPGPAPEVARRHRLAAAAHLGENDDEQAERHLGLAEELTTDPAEQARIVGLRAEQAWRRGDVDTALCLAEVARAHAGMYGTAADLARAEEAMVLVTHLRDGWREGLEAELSRSGAALDGATFGHAFERHHCVGLRHLLCDKHSHGMAEDARQLLTRATDVRSVRAQAFAWCLLGESLLLRGHFDEAAGCLERSTELHAGLDVNCGAVPWLRLAELAACRRRFDEVGPALRQASAITAAAPAARHTWPRVHATAAFARLELGEPELAVRSVRAAAAATARHGGCQSCGASLHPVAAEAYAAIGDAAQARAHAASAAEIAAAFTGSAWQAMAEAAAGSAALAAGDPEAAGRRFRTSAELHEEAGQVYWAGRAHRQATMAARGHVV
ncbi:AfsR/SARP family transcriptional regulator [Actinoplanes aureus]|uniref:Transcriptional regulator n=1 Tax=Actinoplanes aureus TaxID=2792083 RepID=A0A931CP68_9ACTN|nr:BTAD domain-containing putative transcriptional regulator [Actinoplanes aureus]MBG0568510.1 transcriptional regulator [Actinoplanes aureus]